MPDDVSTEAIQVRLAANGAVFVTRVGTSKVFVLRLTVLWPVSAAAASVAGSASQSAAAGVAASPIARMPAYETLHALESGVETQLLNGDTLLFSVVRGKAVRGEARVVTDADASVAAAPAAAPAPAPAVPNRLAQFVLRLPAAASGAVSAAGAGAGAGARAGTSVSSSPAAAGMRADYEEGGEQGDREGLDDEDSEGRSLAGSSGEEAQLSDLAARGSASFEE